MRWTVAALVLVTAACAQESDVPLADATTTTTETTTETTTGSDELQLLWSTEDIHFVSDPVAVAGVVVVYLTADGGLSLAGYDPETGEELWRRPSTASMSTAGVVIHVAADDTVVFHLAPGEDGDVVEALDAETGEPVWTSPAAPDGFNDQVGFCDNSRDTVCTTAGDAGVWELDAETGELLSPSGLIGRPRQEGIDGRRLGTDIYELFDSGDIALVEDGQIVWQKPPSELFGGHAVNPDFGWEFRTVDDGLIVAWLGSQELPETGDVELIPQYTAGIDHATGETRWVEEGSPCGLSALELRVGRDEPWLRCTFEGTVSMADNEILDSEGATTIMGFDPGTGAVDWTADIDGLPLFAGEGVVMARLDSTSFAFSVPGGELVAVDVSDGTVLDVTPEDVGWCIIGNQYPYDSSQFDFRAGAPFHNPCSLDGERQELPADVDEDMGIVVGEVFVWMDEAGLHGARTGD